MTTPTLRRFAFTVAYDGTAYSGWQIQPRSPSVQQTLEETLAGISGQPVKVHGSGRTDQGVHACGQVAHADLTTRMDARSLLRACNARLPADIRIRSAARVRPDFHARRSATRKEYRYFVWNDAVMPPERRLYAAHVPHPLDVSRMREAARAFVGEHDFASFTANPNRAVESTIREIFAFSVTSRGRAITFRVCGNGFLYKQVRSMVGFLLRVGAGAETPEAVSTLLDARAARTARVPSAVPQGLFLWRVWYRSRESGKRKAETKCP